MSTGEIYHRDEFPKLISELDYKIGAEVGVLEGKFTCHLLRNCPQLFMYAIDPWEEIPGYDDMHNSPKHIQNLRYNNTVANLSAYPGRYQIIKDYSVNVAKLLIPESLDFVYIDADHRYESVKADLEAWYPVVRTGGMMAGHDFLDSGENFGVKTAVMEFVMSRKIIWHRTEEDWPSWWFIK